MTRRRTSITTVMISCEQRATARALTIPQLERAGYPPQVFISPCNPAGPDENARIAGVALAWAADRGQPVLFTEDDIDLAPDFGWHAQRAAREDALTYLYLNDSPRRLQAHLGRATARAILTRAPMPRGPYRIGTIAALFGTQAVLIPARLLPDIAALAAATNTHRMPFDGRLHTWARATPSERVLVMLPHPVQHRQDRTGREPSDRIMRSLSHGIRTTADVPEGEIGNQAPRGGRLDA